MGQGFDCGMANPSLIRCPVFLLEVGSISSLSLLSDIASKITPFESWESLISQVSGAFWKVPPTSYFLRLLVYILSAGPQGFSPFPNPIPDQVPSLPSWPSPQIPPSLPPCGCFLLSPKSDRGVLTWVLQLVELFEFCGLYLRYSIFFFLFG